MQIGQRFRVNKARKFEDGGVVIANYLPEADGQPLGYRVTERNKAFVDALEKEGVAFLEQAPVTGPGGKNQLASGTSRVSMGISTKPAKAPKGKKGR